MEISFVLPRGKYICPRTGPQPPPPAPSAAESSKTRRRSLLRGTRGRTVRNRRRVRRNNKTTLLQGWPLRGGSCLNSFSFPCPLHYRRRAGLVLHRIKSILTLTLQLQTTVIKPYRLNKISLPGTAVPPFTRYLF